MAERYSQPRYLSYIHPRVDKAVPASGQAALDPQRSKTQPAVEWSRLRALLQKEGAPRAYADGTAYRSDTEGWDVH